MQDFLQSVDANHVIQLSLQNFTKFETLMLDHSTVRETDTVYPVQLYYGLLGLDFKKFNLSSKFTAYDP